MCSEIICHIFIYIHTQKDEEHVKYEESTEIPKNTRKKQTTLNVKMRNAAKN